MVMYWQFECCISVVLGLCTVSSNQVMNFRESKRRFSREDRSQNSSIHTKIIWINSTAATMKNMCFWLGTNFSVYLLCVSTMPGRIAALNMLNKLTELSSVPFYWTVLLGKTIRYAGGHTHKHACLQYVCLRLCILFEPHTAVCSLYSHMTESVTPQEQ